MSHAHKRRPHRPEKHEQPPTAIRWPAVLRGVVLGGAIALLVIGAMLPSEAAISDGVYAPLAAGWCLLAIVWAGSMWLDERPVLRVGWTETIGAALVGWYSLAAVMSLGQTNGRHALSAQWLMIGYGLTVFLLRQTLRSAEQARSLVAAMIWLAMLLAALGLYQYGYAMPKLRLEYERDKERVLQLNGIPTDAGSPQRELFENRLRSVEPLATFALTNSLAGLLAPWLVAALAIGLAQFRDPKQRRSLIVLAAAALIVGACLVLTKSRTAYLALIAGLILVALYGRRGGRQLDWRIPAALAGAAVVIGLAAIYFGGLDVQVLSEAPKSVLYRIEYWQATARVIAKYPLFGCGPGNFQEAYAEFKLPQASEMVADPHNFLLEMWATAGTPALVLLLGLMIAFAIDVASLARRQSPALDEPDVGAVPAKWLVFGGAVAGLLMGPAVAAALGYPLLPISESARALPVVWLVGLVLVPAVWWGLAPWIDRGELPLAAAVIPQIVLLINLLAAGALVFPAVIATLLVLMPLSLFVAASQARPITAATKPNRLPCEFRVPRLAMAGVALALVAGELACLYSEYYPVVIGRNELASAVEHMEWKRFRKAEETATAAATADALAPEPVRLLTDLRLARWLATGDDQDRKLFVAEADAFRRLDPRHHQAWYQRGNWFLTAWRKSERQEDLKEAIAAYEEASKRYPHRAVYHAQLAWALDLSGQKAAARDEAEKAIDLDRQMPHKEQKLARQHVADPQIATEPFKLFREENAEQTAERLRSPSAEGSP